MCGRGVKVEQYTKEDRENEMEREREKRNRERGTEEKY